MHSTHYTDLPTGYTCRHCELVQYRTARRCLYTVIVMLTLLGVGIAISGIMRHTS